MRLSRSSPLLLISLIALSMAACPKGVPTAPNPSASAGAPGSDVTPSAKPSELPTGVGTLKGDMPLAFKTAVQWATDAQLYEIEGLFIDATGKRDAAQADTWNFRFAAASKPGKFYTVNVSGDEKAVGSESAGEAPYQTFARGSIGLDSPAACRIAKATGSEVRMHVYFDPRLGTLVYLFPDLDRLRLDAWNGDVLSP